MNYLQIKVNPYIHGIEETIRKNEEELLNKSAGIFDGALFLDSVNKGFLNLIDKEGVSFEYKGSHLDLSYYINSNFGFNNIKTAVQSSFPVSDFIPSDFETNEIIEKKIIVKNGDDYTVGDDYVFLSKSYIVKNNDISILSTYSVNKIDYFHKVLSILGDLFPEEYSRYQVTIAPSTDYFKKEIQTLDSKLNNLKEKEGLNIFDKENKQLSTSLKNMLDSISKEKYNSKGFFTIIRFHFLGKKESQARLEEKINNISKVIEKLSVYDSVFTEINEGEDYLYNYYNSYLNHKAISNGSLLVKPELLNIFHFPILGNTKIPNINLQLFQKLPIPGEVVNNEPQSGDIVMGINDFGGKQNNYVMDDNIRFKHTYVLGKSGTGKSTLLETAVLQDIYNGKGVFLLDPHGDLVDNIMERFPDPRNPKYKDRYKDLIYINFKDKDKSVGINILESNDEYEESKMINAFTELLQKIFPDSGESMGPTFFEYIIYCIKTVKLMEKIYKPTLGDIVRVLNNEDYRRRCLSQIKDTSKYMDIFDFWDNHQKRTGDGSQSQNKDEILPYIRTKLTKFIENPYISNVVSQPDSTVDFFDAMNTNKIILIKMAKGDIGEENMKFLGLIVISKLLMDIFKRTSIKEADRVPFFIYVDEFQNFITKEFEQILSEARKFKTGLTIAHQYIDQLINQKTKDESVQKAVFGNAGTVITFRVGSNDTPKLEELFGNKVLLPKESFINIDKYHAYVSTQGGSSTVKTLQPFHIKTFISDKPKILKRDETGKIIGNGEVDDSLIEKIIAYSKNKYSGGREKVDLQKQKFSSYFSD